MKTVIIAVITAVSFSAYAGEPSKEQVTREKLKGTSKSTREMQKSVPVPADSSNPNSSKTNRLKQLDQKANATEKVPETDFRTR